LSTTQLPAASAGASFHAAISSGKFHGMICADHAERFVEVVGDGVGLSSSPDRAFLRAQDAGEVAEVIDGQRQVGGRVSRIGLPLSIVSITASASRFSSSRSAMRLRMIARSVTEVRPHGRRALCAASSASSTSSAVLRATSHSGWPVMGVMFVKYCPRTGATARPPIQLS
jgi:hypothetical protein